MPHPPAAEFGLMGDKTLKGKVICRHVSDLQVECNHSRQFVQRLERVELHSSSLAREEVADTQCRTNANKTRRSQCKTSPALSSACSQLQSGFLCLPSHYQSPGSPTLTAKTPLREMWFAVQPGSTPRGRGAWIPPQPLPYFLLLMNSAHHTSN